MVLKSDPIDRIVIVGGGTAGWMTAAALSNQLQANATITLIESEEIGTVGVGEATIPPIRQFNQLLGIDENEFVRACQGSFKLGIEFVNWGDNGQRYFHPFGPFGKAFDTVSLHHYWYAAYESGQADPLDDYSMAWVAAKSGKFAPPERDPRNILSTFDYAYHFDAGLYARFLRAYSEQRSVKRIEGKVSTTSLHPDTGFVNAVIMESGELVQGDLFIDCSGFRGLLIEQALQTGYEDWSHWLPCDRAWAVPSARGEFTPYTRSIAHQAGWQWRIPLQNRAGNGHVFCSAFMDENRAADVLMDNLSDSALDSPRLLKFQTGRRRKFWNKNVVAIGLASGFLEPLESTSIHLIQSGIAKLLALFPDKSFDESTSDEYNRVAAIEMENIRDFILLHYCLNRRQDGELWRYCSNMPLPDRLSHRIHQFRKFGRLVPGEKDLFGDASWLAVHIGQFNWPERVDPLASFRKTNYVEWLRRIRTAMEAGAAQLPTHQEYVARFCAA